MAMDDLQIQSDPMPCFQTATLATVSGIFQDISSCTFHIEGTVLMMTHLKMPCEMQGLCIACISTGFILMHFVLWEANVNAQSKALRRCLLFGGSFGWVAGNHCTSSPPLGPKLQGFKKKLFRTNDRQPLPYRLPQESLRYDENPLRS